MDQLGDGVEGVEEEVRVDLRLERLQFRLGGQGSQLLFLLFFLLQLTEETQGHLGAVDDGEHNHHAPQGDPGRGGHDLEVKKPTADEQGQQRAQDVIEQREGHLQSQVYPVPGQLLQAGVQKSLVQPIQYKDRAADGQPGDP
jgi:hypothetical protein